MSEKSGPVGFNLGLRECDQKFQKSAEEDPKGIDQKEGGSRNLAEAEMVGYLQKVWSKRGD